MGDQRLGNLSIFRRVEVIRMQPELASLTRAGAFSLFRSKPLPTFGRTHRLHEEESFFHAWTEAFTHIWKEPSSSYGEGPFSIHGSKSTCLLGPMFGRIPSSYLAGVLCTYLEHVFTRTRQYLFSHVWKTTFIHIKQRSCFCTRRYPPEHVRTFHFGVHDE